MYLTINELKTALYAYQAQEISENDDDILLMNIEAAQGEVHSYLAGRYDVDSIFAATGSDRNQLLLELTKNIALWYLLRLSNVDIIYQPAKERYNSAIDWLTKVADGMLNPNLPPKTDDNGIAEGGVSWGSSETRKDNSY
jgi:phage gp36-like protein